MNCSKRLSEKGIFIESIIVCTLILILSIASNSASSPMKSSITVHGDKLTARLHRLVFGSNLQWEHAGDGIFDVSALKIRPQVVKFIREMGITSLRYPGGSLADTFPWRSSVGPMDSRGYGTTYDGKHEKIYFGLDEFITLCKSNNIEPVITVNFNISPKDAAALVEYLNGDITTVHGKLRGDYGHKIPYGVHFFEIGNEIYSHIEPGHCSVEIYAKKFKAMRKAMKAVDPSIAVGACCEVSFQKAPWARLALPDLITWNERLATLAGTSIDFLSCHFYGPFDISSDKKKLLKAIFALPMVFSDTVQELKSIFPSHIKIAVTEYGLGFGDKAPLDPMSAGYESALFDCLMLETFIKEDVFMANHWSLIGNSVFGMIESASTMRLRPGWYVMKALSGIAMPYILKTDVTSPLYDVTPIGSLPAMTIPWIHALVFAENLPETGSDYKGKIAIVITNPNSEKAVEITLKLQNLAKDLTIKKALLYEKGPRKSDLDTVKMSPVNVDVLPGIIKFSMPPASFMTIQMYATDMDPLPPKKVKAMLLDAM